MYFTGKFITENLNQLGYKCTGIKRAKDWSTAEGDHRSEGTIVTE